MKIILCDLEKELVEEWKQRFSEYKNVKVLYGDIFSVRSDALVAPGNCQGFMSGGLDKTIVEYFGEKIQKKVIDTIKIKHNGKLNIGEAEIIKTENNLFPYLIYAPTMSISLEDSVKGLQRPAPYKTMTGILNAIKEYNQNNKDKINSVAMPGLGTGNGNVPFLFCALDMKKAYDEFNSAL